MEQTKQVEIQILSNKEKDLGGGKIVWNILDQNEKRYSCWDKTISKLLQPKEVFNIRYTEKPQGEYINRYIVAAQKQLEDGSGFGEWVEQTKTVKAGGGWSPKPMTPEDRDGMNTAIALKAASKLGAAYMQANPKTATNLSLAGAAVITLAKQIKAGLFGSTLPKAESLPAAKPVDRKPVAEMAPPPGHMGSEPVEEEPPF